jgi:hypothetical protein
MCGCAQDITVLENGFLSSGRLWPVAIKETSRAQRGIFRRLSSSLPPENCVEFDMTCVLCAARAGLALAVPSAPFTHSCGDFAV